MIPLRTTSVPLLITLPGATTIRAFVNACTAGVLLRSPTVGAVWANAPRAATIRAQRMVHHRCMVNPPLVNGVGMEECFNFGAIIRGKNDYPLEKFLPFQATERDSYVGDQRRR